MASVVGIFPNLDALSNLAHTMKSGGLDSRELTIISNDDPTGYLTSIGAEFIKGLDATRIYGDVAIQVPGLGAKEPSEYEGAGSSPALEALSDLSVPDGRTDDYMKAVEAGRCVAGFAAGDKADAVKALFTAAGGNPVATF